MIPLAEMVVNLADNTEAHYVKATMILEVSGATGKTEVDQATPKIPRCGDIGDVVTIFRDLSPAKGRAISSGPSKRKSTRFFATFAGREHLLQRFCDAVTAVCLCPSAKYIYSREEKPKCKQKDDTAPRVEPLGT